MNTNLSIYHIFIKIFVMRVRGGKISNINKVIIFSIVFTVFLMIGSVSAIDSNVTIDDSNLLNENNKIVRGEDYVCGQRVSLDLAELKQILDKDYYIETENNTALGLYRPIAMLNFNDELGNTYSVFYSFMNAEVRFYQNAKILKVAMMYDSDHILGIFNKLN